MKIGDEVYVHGYVDEIRNDVVIIRNDGGYFGTVFNEVIADRKTENSSEIPNNCEPKICDTCRYYNNYIPCGSTPSACKEADKFAEEFVDGLKKLKQTEPTSSKMEQVDEPQTYCGDFADRLAYERGVKHAWEVAQKVFNSTVTFYEAEDVAKQIDKDINVRSKDEPKTQMKTQNSNLTFDKADEPQTERYCTNCKHNGVIADYECRECCGMDKHEFIEPQTDCPWK